MPSVEAASAYRRSTASGIPAATCRLISRLASSACALRYVRTALSLGEAVTEEVDGVEAVSVVVSHAVRMVAAAIAAARAGYFFLFMLSLSWTR